MRWKSALVALVALVLPGCDRGPSLQSILDGEIEVTAAEREALREVFADVRPSEVEIALDENVFRRSGTFRARVSDGRVVAVTASGAVPTQALSQLAELQRLKLYRGEFSDLRGLGPWPTLEKLYVESRRLESLEGIGSCCPRLRELTVSRAPIDDLGPLGGLEDLERLQVDHNELTDLGTAPTLPSLRVLWLSYGPLAALVGLENFEGLEELQLFGTKELKSLETLASLENLRELRLFQTGLLALSLPPLSALERIEASGNKILSARLTDLPRLRELEMHEEDLVSLELAPLPSLERVDLEGEGSIFEHGRLDRLEIATQPNLQHLGLQRNRLWDLTGLAPQPALRRVELDRNPIAELDLFLEGFPELRSVSIHRTAVREIPAAFQKAGVAVSHDPSEVEANYWEGVLRAAFEAQRDAFVETLPHSGGRVERHRARCTLRTATFSTPRLDCTGSIDRLSGLVHLQLAEVDPLSPASGGPNHFPIRATLSVEKGRARIYLKYRLDPQRQAEALAGYRDPDRPLFELGDGRGENAIDGFAFAEARPGEPGTTSGEAHVLVDQLMIWVEGLDGAEGIDYVIESR